VDRLKTEWLVPLHKPQPPSHTKCHTELEN
jgi:hypothetical protein